MLYKRRKRLADLAQREADGESFWTDEFDEPIRRKLIHYLVAGPYPIEVMRSARTRIMTDEGLANLGTTAMAENDFQYYVLNGSSDDVATAVEAVYREYIDGLANNREYRNDIAREYAEGANRLSELWNTALKEHRVRFEFIEGAMIEIDSQELHAEVVAPALRLLSGRSGWDQVEAAYRAALEELHGGTPEDAITDAGTALQETLVSLGCDGNALGPLLDDARRRGLLAAHDSPLIDAIKKIGDWVSADRSMKGDAHNASSALPEDAWLTVHIVGALILRLASGTPRA